MTSTPSSTPSCTPSPRRLLTGSALVLCSLALAACGTDSGTAAAGDSGAGTGRAGDTDAPAACAEAFPVAAGEADLSEVTLLPADWPEAPAGATLCRTSATLDGTIQTAEYATAASAAEVLAAYQQALPPAYGASTEREALGDALVGASGEVSFEITPRDGAFSLAFTPR